MNIGMGSKDTDVIEMKEIMSVVTGFKKYQREFYEEIKGIRKQNQEMRGKIE